MSAPGPESEDVLNETIIGRGVLRPGAFTGACVPGRNGLPCGWIPRLLCDPNGQASRLGHVLLHALAQVISAVWPVLLPVCAVVLTAIPAVSVISARCQAGSARRGWWVEIACPAEVHPDGGAVLWRLLAQRLARGRFAVARRVVAWELHATADGVRAGLWVPRHAPAAPVAAAVSDAWPGAQARTGSVGLVPARPQPSPLTAVRLRPAGPDWLPISAVDRQMSHRSQPHQADVLRVVFGALSACRVTEGTLAVQILVRRASRRTSRRINAAARHLRGLPPKRGLVRGVVLGFLDLITGPAKTPSRTAASSPQVTDPLGPARLHALAAKAAASPHFEVTIRVAAAGGNAALRWELVNTVTSGFELVTLDAPVPADLTTRRLWLPAERFAGRHAPGRHWFSASLPEVAALAHLPAEPARYGLSIAAARRFPPPPEALAA